MNNIVKAQPDDTYRVFIPIEDTELMKSVEVDANGDYIVQGVMTSDEKDEEDDSISPEGMDCSYFLSKGWVKYEHGNAPQQFIGEPLEVRVGRFKHPTLSKSVNGVFVKARLFAQRELAKQAVTMLQDLQKSHTTRRMGWSIEGNVKERDRKTGKIVKSVLRNVVLTLNPVNTSTWAELSKSFAKNHEVTIDMEMDKSMDLSGAAAIMPQSLEGSTVQVAGDDQEKWIKLFRDFVKSFKLSKSLQDKLIASPPGAVGMTAYKYALGEDLDNEAAYEFAAYIAARHDVLKSLFGTNKHGGESMKSNKIESLLDDELEELRKSLNDEENDDPEEDGDSKKDDDEDDDDENDDCCDDKTEKSIKSDFAKSLAGSVDGAQEAFEVSEFLVGIADQIGFNMDGFAKSMAHMTKQSNVIVKALTSTLEAVQGLTAKVEDLEAENSDLKKSLGELLERPVGRKSVVNGREVNTLTKGINKGSVALNRAKIGDILMKSFEKGDLAGSEISRFEAGVSLSQLNLPASVKEELGM